MSLPMKTVFALTAVFGGLIKSLRIGEDAEGEELNDELRGEAVEDFLDLLDKPKLPPILAQTTAWVLGMFK
jgi:hypothetical protein